jgi:hypothetical protein
MHVKLYKIELKKKTCHYNAAEETSAIGGGDFLSPPLPALISSTIEEPIAPVVGTSSTSRPLATAPKTKNCKREGKTSNASRANISKSIASIALQFPVWPQCPRNTANCSNLQKYIVV